MDPKNPSKSSDFTKMPKFFQVGTVIDNGGIIYYLTSKIMRELFIKFKEENDHPR